MASGEEMLMDLGNVPIKGGFSEDKQECDACGYATHVINHEDGMPCRVFKFCKVCYSTMCGTKHVWSQGQTHVVLDILKHISICTNMILDAIKESKDAS